MDSQFLQDYEINQVIGEGTFGKVRVGFNRSTKRKVAIKILEKSKIVDEADFERVSRELLILQNVNHPNVVQVHEIIEEDQYIFIIMHYADGGELFDYIVQNNRLQEEEACRIFHQLICGIEYIHKLGISHRDLKPENLLLDGPEKNLLIVDFGLSNILKDSDLLKTSCGSPSYAAPEMIQGKFYDGQKTDIWSCGVILYAMICGYLPFEEINTQELYEKIMIADFQFPSFVSVAASNLIKNIITVDPAKRYSIREIKADSWYKMFNVKQTNRYRNMTPVKCQLMPDSKYVFKKTSLRNSLMKKTQRSKSPKHTTKKESNLQEVQNRVMGLLETNSTTFKQNILKKVQKTSHTTAPLIFTPRREQDPPFPNQYSIIQLKKNDTSQNQGISSRLTVRGTNLDQSSTKNDETSRTIQPKSPTAQPTMRKNSVVHKTQTNGRRPYYFDINVPIRQVLQPAQKMTSPLGSPIKPIRSPRQILHHLNDQGSRKQTSKDVSQEILSSALRLNLTSSFPNPTELEKKTKPTLDISLSKLCSETAITKLNVSDIEIKETSNQRIKYVKQSGVPKFQMPKFQSSVKQCSLDLSALVDKTSVSIGAKKKQASPRIVHKQNKTLQLPPKPPISNNQLKQVMTQSVSQINPIKLNSSIQSDVREKNIQSQHTHQKQSNQSPIKIKHHKTESAQLKFYNTAGSYYLHEQSILSLDV